MRKQGTTLQPEEEILKKKLEEMDSELNSPTQYKGRLNELLSQIRLHKSSLDGRPIPRYNIDPSSLIPVKEFLFIQQESVKHLVATIKSDEETVKEMGASINKMLSKVPT
jgi:nuclear pore complex protein Nup54